MIRSASIENTAFAVLLVALGIAAVLSLTWPLGYDQGVYAWVAHRIMAGGRPYVDAWENHGPAAHLSYALVQAVIGTDPWALRAFDLLMLAMGAVSIFAAVGHLTCPLTRRWTALLFAFWYLGGTFYHTAQPDGWVALALVPALLPFVVMRGPHRISDYVVAGTVVGCAGLVKHLYLAFLLVPLLATAYGSMRSVSRRLGALALAGTCPWVAALWWLSQDGALAEYFDIHFIYASTVYASPFSLDIGSRATGFVRYVTTTPIVAILIAPSVSGALILRRRTSVSMMPILAWLLLGLSIVLVQNKFFFYHWLLPFPPMAILAAVGFGEALVPSMSIGKEAPQRWPASLLAASLFAVVAFHCLVHPMWETARGVAFVTRMIDANAYADGFGIPGPSRRAAQYIEQHSQPEDRVVIWGLNADILYLGKREPPGRFGFLTPLVVGVGSPYTSKYRTEFLESFDREKPIFVIEDRSLSELFGSSARLEDFHELQVRIARNYREVARFAKLVIWRSTAGEGD